MSSKKLVYNEHIILLSNIHYHLTNFTCFFLCILFFHNVGLHHLRFYTMCVNICVLIIKKNILNKNKILITKKPPASSTNNNEKNKKNKNTCNYNTAISMPTNNFLAYLPMHPSSPPLPSLPPPLLLPLLLQNATLSVTTVTTATPPATMRLLLCQQFGCLPFFYTFSKNKKYRNIVHLLKPPKIDGC